MFQGARVAVVVPAFNEADKIALTVRSVPGFVDDVIVVDDGSGDGTGAEARASRQGARLEVVIHPENRGVGAAIATGYARAVARGADVVAVMAGDGQMDPTDLPRLLAPIVDGRADYVKGNRLAWPGGWRRFPLVRLTGSVVLSWLTRFATGYRHLFDSQCGYTAASRRALLAARPEQMYPRYGYPNDLLSRLADVGARVLDVPVRPVYGGAWRSGLRPWRVAWPLSRILLRGFARRLSRRRHPPPVLGREPPRCESAS
ncbi:MAG TPA: glycosyltransferase family 2 protein [Polyangia bacterium]|nr:glycosyltransferase family 2 protein [Polyangia bacterium]